MTIIEHGKFFENHYFICGCGCKWKAGLTEVVFEPVEDDEDIYSAAVCKCPECDVDVIEEDWKRDENCYTKSKE